jgi:mannose-6-phosphate isomerase-like protein (cupin superfamily)
MRPIQILTMAIAVTLTAVGGHVFAAEVPLARGPDDPSLSWGPCPNLFPNGCEIAVLHGDPGRPNADLLLRAPGGYNIPPHTHSSAERMILVRGTLKVKYAGAPEMTLKPGMYAYGPPGLAHHATCEGAEPCVLFIAFESPVDALAPTGPVN